MEGRGKTEDSDGAEDRPAKNSVKRNGRRRMLVEDGG
jgi:hypothetical protein